MLDKVLSVVMTEVDLPRGGSIVEKKEKRHREDPEDDGLFKKKAKQDDKKKGKVDLPEGHESSGKENELDGIWKNPITQEVMVDGVLGLGYVAEIRSYDVILETASSFRVTLPITELGPYGLAEVKADRLQLEDAFPIGHALPFKVLAKEKIVKKKPLNKPAPTESSAVKVTIDPAKINKHLGPTTIFIGLAVAAEVKSIEEKGLLLDLGLKNTSAFLSKDLLPNGFTAKVGLPLTVRIQSTSNMRMLQVALAVEMDTLSQEAVSSLSLRSIMPGTIILASPLQTKSEGAYVSLGNGVNAWLPRRAMPPRMRANIESFVKPLRVVILLCQQNSRLLCVSAHPDIVAVSRPEKRRNFEGVRLGDVLKCEVTRCSGGKVEMSIVKEEEDDGKGSLVIVTATKATLDGATNEKRYAVGSQHEMRVLGLKIAERTINVGNTKEIMKQPMVSFHDAKGGAKVSAVIKQLTTAGVHVVMFNRIRGFIPIRYMCDKPVASVEKAFPINDSIPCRVLTSSEEHRNILLTARKSQVSDEGILITDFSSVRPGQTCVGVVVHQFPRGGSLVSFYNDIRGMLSDVECRKKKNLQVGDAVTVRVVSVDEERKRLELAVADGSLPVNVVVKAKEASILSSTSLNGIVEAVNTGGKVKKSGGEGVVLNVDSSSLTVSPSLLSDCLDSPFSTGSLDEVLPSNKVVGQELSLLPLGDQSGLQRATLKRLLIEWSSTVGGMPTKMEEIESGMILSGVVSQRVVDYGYTIELPGGSGIVGKIPFSAINEGASGERALSIGQTVIVRVATVDAARKRMELTLDWSTPSSTSPFNLSLQLVKSAIGEQQWLGERHELPLLGEKISGVVVQVMEDVCLLRVEGRTITAYARKGNFPRDKIKKDVTVSAVCIDYVWPRGDVEVLIVEEEEKGDKKKKGGKKEKKEKEKETVSTPRVIVTRRDYLAVLAEGSIVYTPARVHPNHVVRIEELPAVGSSIVLSGDTEEIGGVGVGEREGTEERLEKAKKDMEGNGRTMPKKNNKMVEDDDERGSVTHVKKYGIYKARVEGLVELPKDAKKAAGERARCALLLKFSGGVLGRLHVSELPSRFLVEGSNPMESFLSEYQHRSVHVLVMTLKHVVVDERKLIICDVTLNEEKMANVKKSKKTVDFRNKFHIGDIVPVYYSAHGLKGQVVYEVNPRWRALVEGTTDKNTVNPDCGVMKSVKVLAINKQSQELTVVLTDKMKLQPGSLCTARFHSAALHPIKTQVTVSSGEIGLLTLTSICDDFEKAVKKMKEMKNTPNQLMDVRLLAHHPDARTYQWIVVTKERSAKKNGVTDPLIKSRDDVTEGSTLRGFVAYIKKDEVKIEIGPGVLAELMEESEERESLKVNDLVSLRVVEVDEDGDIYVEVEEIVQNNHSAGERKRLSSTATDSSETPKKRGKGEKGEKEERKREEKQKKELVDPGFDWSSSAFSMDAMAEIGGIGGKMSGLKVDSEKEEEMEVDGEEKKTVKKEKKKKSEMSVAELEVEKEKKLSAQERRMMDKEAELTSDADYARVLKGNPNEAQMWIEYMSHFIKKDELAKARATAEKALITINYREDAQLFTLWCAYLNLEVVFGDAESWNGVFTRACESADSFKMHKHMAATLAQNDKFTEADAVYEKMIKKFRAQSDEVWTLNAEYLYSNDREEEARALMTRALQCVPKTKHVALISRFAALEYTKGDQEKGRNLFENLLATYPKKTEVWSTYVDLSVKYATVDQTRHVLERVTSLPLSVFKLRQFYKKWIDLETKEGDEKSLAEVKRKALQYVTSLKEILDE